MVYYIIKYPLEGLLSYTDDLFKTEIHNSKNDHLVVWVLIQSASQYTISSCTDDLNKNHNHK